MTDTGPVRGGPQRIPRPPGARAGDPAPWAALPEAARRPSTEQVLDALRTPREPRPSLLESAPGPLQRPPSAVLAPLYDHRGEPWLVFTRRAWHLRSHTGEVSFPGGRIEDGDSSLWDTACREAWEEVDLDRDAVERVTELDHLATVTSRSFIVPYVGLLPGRPDLTPNPDEVDAVLHVPVAELLDPEIYRQERWGIAGLDRPIHFFELVGDTLWGATASMLVDLLGRITSPNWQDERNTAEG